MEARLKYGAETTVKYAHSSSVSAGEVLNVGSWTIVASHDYEADELGAYYVGPAAFEVTAGSALAAGVATQWNDTTKRVVGAAAGDFDFGKVSPNNSASTGGDVIEAWLLNI